MQRQHAVPLMFWWLLQPFPPSLKCQVRSTAWPGIILRCQGQGKGCGHLVVTKDNDKIWLSSSMVFLGNNFSSDEELGSVYLIPESKRWSLYFPNKHRRKKRGKKKGREKKDAFCIFCVWFPLATSPCPPVHSSNVRLLGGGGQVCKHMMFSNIKQICLPPHNLFCITTVFFNLLEIVIGIQKTFSKG